MLLHTQSSTKKQDYYTCLCSKNALEARKVGSRFDLKCLIFKVSPKQFTVKPVYMYKGQSKDEWLAFYGQLGDTLMHLKRIWESPVISIRCLDP